MTGGRVWNGVIGAVIVLLLASGCAPGRSESVAPSTTLSPELLEYLHVLERREQAAAEYAVAVERAQRRQEHLLGRFYAGLARAERQQQEREQLQRMAERFEAMYPPGGYPVLPGYPCFGDSYINSFGDEVCAPSYTPQAGGYTARCADGTYSSSGHRQGTCAHHGGVSSWGG